MRTVFLLQHCYEIEDVEEVKIIGIYSTREKAEATIERYKYIIGFKEYPLECFHIDEYEIDSDNWQEGFIKWEHATRRKEESNNEVKEIVRLLNCKPSETRILDIGCGLGYHMQALGQLGYSVVGTEVSDFSYEKAKQNTQAMNGKVYKVLAKDMIWNNQFDLAIAIHHTLGYMNIEELYVHLEKIKNALKQDGSFILNVPYTLESSFKSLPVNKWTKDDNKYILVDKYVTEDNYKIEKCVIIDVNTETVEEFYEKQRYYYSHEIKQILEKVGFIDIQILKNFSGDKATNGEEAIIYLCKK